MPRPAAAVPAEPAAAAAPDFSLAGDEDRGYLLELENALETINGHSLFSQHGWGGATRNHKL